MRYYFFTHVTFVSYMSLRFTFLITKFYKSDRFLLSILFILSVICISLNNFQNNADNIFSLVLCHHNWHAILFLHTSYKIAVNFFSIVNHMKYQANTIKDISFLFILCRRNFYIVSFCIQCTNLKYLVVFFSNIWDMTLFEIVVDLVVDLAIK